MDSSFARARVDSRLVQTLVSAIGVDTRAGLTGDIVRIAGVVVQTWLVEGLEGAICAAEDWRQDLIKDSTCDGRELRGELSWDRVGKDREASAAEITGCCGQIHLGGNKSTTFVSTQRLKVEEEDVCSIRKQVDEAVRVWPPVPLLWELLFEEEGRDVGPIRNVRSRAVGQGSQSQGSRCSVENKVGTVGIFGVRRTRSLGL